MASIPYNPVPQVAPQETPVGKVGINTPVAAFGGATAEATQELGKDVSGVGNELFGRAMALQQLKNEADANNAASKNLLESGKADNDFKLLSGSQPQEKLQEHIEKLTDIRAANRQGLSPMAQKMYDQETLRRFGYDVVGAGGYAAQQFKAYTHQSRESLIAVQQERIASDPSYLTEGKARIDELERANTISEGSTDAATIENRVRIRTGQTIDKLTNAMARGGNVDGAATTLEQWKDHIPTLVYDKAKNNVDQYSVQQHAGLDARAVTDVSPDILDRAQHASSMQESGGRYNNVTTTINAKSGKSQSALGKYGIMETNLPEWSQATLGRNVSTEEFLRTPALQDQMYRAKMGEYIKKYGVEGAGRAWLGGEGAATNPAADSRTDAFDTRVDQYGKSFAALVGSDSPQSLSEQASLAAASGRLAALAPLRFPDNPVLQEKYLEAGMAKVRVNVNVQNAELRQHVQGLQLSAGQVLGTNVSEFGGPRTLEEANKVNPQFQETVNEWAKYNPQAWTLVNARFQANSKAEPAMTEAQMDKYDELTGMAHQKDRREEFVNTNIEALGLPRTANNRLQKLQDEAKSKTGADTLVSRLAGSKDVTSLIHAQGLHESSTDPTQAKKYSQFYGRFTNAVNDFVAQNPGKPIDAAKITAQVLTKVEVPGSVWGTNTKRMMDVEKTTPVVLPKDPAEAAKVWEAMPRGQVFTRPGETQQRFKP